MGNNSFIRTLLYWFYSHHNIFFVGASTALVVYSIIWFLRSFWALPILTLLLGVAIWAATLVHPFLKHNDIDRPYFWLRLESMFLLLSSIATIYAVATLYHAYYARPLSFFISLSISIALLGIWAVTARRINGHCARLAMALIIAVSLILRSSSYVINGYIPPADNTLYSRIINAVFEEKHLTGEMWPWPNYLLAYPSSVFYNLISLELMGLGPEHFPLPTFASIIVVPLSAYLIGKSLGGQRLGLVVALMASTSFGVAQSFSVTPSSFGSIMFLFSLALLIFAVRNRRYMWLFFVISFSAFLYFPVAGIMLIVILLTTSLVSRLLRRRVLILATLACTTIFISYAMFHPYDFFTVLVREGMPLGYHFTPTATPPGSTAGFDLGMMMGYTFSYLGLSILVFLGALGWFDWVLRKKRSTEHLVMAFGVPALILIPVVGVLAGSFSFSLIRVYSYFAIALVILAGVGILRLAQTRRRSIVIICMILLLLYSLSTQTSPYADPDNNLFTFGLAPGNIHTTPAVLSAHSWLDYIPRDALLVMDSTSGIYYGHYNPKDGSAWMDGSSLFCMGFINVTYIDYSSVGRKEAYIVMNYPALQRGTLVNGSMVRLDLDLLESALGSSNIIYSNPDLVVYKNP